MAGPTFLGDGHTSRRGDAQWAIEQKILGAIGDVGATGFNISPDVLVVQDSNGVGGSHQLLFRFMESADGTDFQHLEFDFTNSGTANPDFVAMRHGSRLWFFDLDVLGDEVGIVIGSNGHPGLSDARGWTNSYSFTATKSDLNPATATAAQCAERINALINALTRLSTSEGHGLLR